MNKLKYLILFTFSALLFTSCQPEKTTTAIKQQVGYVIKDNISRSNFQFELNPKILNFKACDELTFRLYSILETKDKRLDYANFTLLAERNFSDPNALFFRTGFFGKKLIKKNQNYLWEITCKNEFTETRKISTFTTATTKSKAFQGLNQIINNGFVTPDGQKTAPIKYLRATRFNRIPSDLCIHYMSGGNGMEIQGDTFEIFLLDNPRIGEVNLSNLNFDTSSLNMKFNNTVSITSDVTTLSPPSSEITSDVFFNEINPYQITNAAYQLYDENWDNLTNTALNPGIYISDYTDYADDLTDDKLCYFKVNMDVGLSSLFSKPPGNRKLNVVCFLGKNGGGQNHTCTSSTGQITPADGTFGYYSCCANSTGHISNHVLITNFIF